MPGKFLGTIGAALHVAAYYGHEALIGELLKIGAAVTVRDTNRNVCTVLHYATMNG